tara:strand:- start:43 stop:444 length:402 start_codon:yes stop_codon:yes gene_type:complete
MTLKIISIGKILTVHLMLVKAFSITFVFFLAMHLASGCSERDLHWYQEKVLHDEEKWFLVSTLLAPKSVGRYDVISEKSFSSFEECKQYEQYINKAEDFFWYSQICIEKTDLEYVTFDDTTDKFDKKNVFKMK